MEQTLYDNTILIDHGQLSTCLLGTLVGFTLIFFIHNSGHLGGANR